MTGLVVYEPNDSQRMYEINESLNINETQVINYQNNLNITLNISMGHINLNQ